MNSIEASLPTPPNNHHYEVEPVSKLITKVWLVRDEPSPYLGKEIRTIYAFIKGKKVHAPKSHKMSQPKSHCLLSELPWQRPYSLIIPTTTSLQHIK